MEFVTSGNLAYFKSHGERFVRSFLSYVDPSISLRIYGEASREGVVPEAYLPADLAGPRIRYVDLFTETPLGPFLEAARPYVEKKIGPVARTAEERLKSKTYNYRFDAMTFCRKVFAFCHAIRSEPSTILIWSDIDIVFYKALGSKFIEALFQERDLFYFGRTDQHSETGVIGFRTGRKGVQKLALRMEAAMMSLSFTRLPGWTDCHIFDHHRALLEREKLISSLNLSKGQVGHVIARSCLAPYLDHLKGPRKLSGSSPEREAHLGKPK